MPSRSELPSGTVAFLFTDIEGSTRRWQRDPRAMAAAVARHDALLRAAIAEHGGVVFKTVGDAFCAAFATVPPAVATALDAQRALAAEQWGDIGAIRVRMAVHVGDAEERDADYFGPAVNRVARLLSAGHGGQLLLSLPAAELVRDSLPGVAQLRDLGEHRLKDLTRPEHIFQLIAADLPADFPPLATLDHHPNNLPPQLTPLVGREQELADVRALLDRADVRLVSLTGPGGTGKTRLSLQVGTDAVDDYADGVWFVALEKATDETVAVAELAQALGVREIAGQSPLDAVTEYLRDKRLLLVLDNFEQVVHEAPLVARLLGGSPGIKMLVTSRVRLALQGEHEYSVPPLEVPSRRAEAAVPELMGCSAIRLFVERARAAKSDFTLTDDNAAAVVEICRRLDGLPLAIELAAARVKLLPPRAMLSRLENRLNLLTGGGRDRPARQQTLRGAIAWSYDLLAPEEQTLFARLAVCAGGCVFEAAEIVGNADGDLDLLTSLEMLVDHSLVRQVEDADGEPRFLMLATIREYARERLAASDEADAMDDRHAAWCVSLAEEAEPALLGPEQQVWLERLEREHDNLRAALTWNLGNARGEQGVRLAGALARFWEMRGHLSEGRRWLEAALATNADIPAGLTAKALRGLASLMVAQGDYEPAAALYEQSLTLYRDLGDERSTADALAGLASTASHRGDYERAAAFYEQSLSLFQQLKNEWGIAVTLNGMANDAHDLGNFEKANALYEQSLKRFEALGSQRDTARALNNLATIAHDRGDYPRAMALYERSQAVTRALHDTRNLAMTLNNQGIAAQDQGDLATAAALYQESLDLFRNLGNRRGVAVLLLGLGFVAEDQGDHVRATAFREESLTTSRLLGDKRGIANALTEIANAAHHNGDDERAEQLLREALELRRDIGDRQGIAECLGGLAAVAHTRGWHERAARLYGAEMAIRQSIGTPRTPAGDAEHERILSQAKSGLGEAAFAVAWAAGQALSLEETVAEALQPGA